MMLEEVCGEIRNFFIPKNGIHRGKYSILNGTMDDFDFLIEGQYFRIVGSRFNDGVYRYPASGLEDEDFDGAIWEMSPPPSFLALVKEIESWSASEEAKASAFQSESFGGYSYTKATDQSGAPLTWKSIFASRLNQWRRMRIL